MQAFNETNPVTVGNATKKDNYDRVFENTKALRSALHASLAFGFPFETDYADFKSVDGVFAGNGVAVDVYTAGAACIAWVTVVNQDLANHAIYVYANGSDVAHTIHVDGTMGLRSVFPVPIPVFLSAGQKIKAESDAANAVAVRVDAMEFAALPTGVTLKVIDGIAPVAGTDTTLYTVPGGVTKSMLVGMTFANRSGSQSLVIMNTPSVASAFRAHVDLVPDKQPSFCCGPIVMDPGDIINVNCANASVGVRAAVIEFTN